MNEKEGKDRRTKGREGISEGGRKERKNACAKRMKGKRGGISRGEEVHVEREASTVNINSLPLSYCVERGEEK